MRSRDALPMGLLLVSSMLLVVGCKPARPEPDAGLANPASVYCTGLGYEEDTRAGDAGEYGVCIFPDGSECDSWDFLAGRCGVDYSYCVQQGYMLKASPESSIGTCVFDDGSTCDEFQYFQGECKPGA